MRLRLLQLAVAASLAFAGTSSISLAQLGESPVAQGPVRLLSDADIGLDSRDAARDKLRLLHLRSEDIKDELARTGRVVRRKAGKAGQAVTDATADARITAAIKTKLVADHDLSTFNVSAYTTAGVVTFKGTVSSPEQIGKAMLLAMETAGVREVISELGATAVAKANPFDQFDASQPARPTATAGAKQDWGAPLIFLVGGIVLLLLWHLWLYFSPGSGDRSACSQTAEGYIRSNCRSCGGSIEFPEHGLSEWIDCPHCNRQIQLRRMGATERFLLGVRVWCRERGFNWKWASALFAVMLVCGTALFIYADIKAQAAARAKREAEAEEKRDYQRNYYLAQQTEAMRQANEIAEEAQKETRRKELEDSSPSLSSLLRPSLAQQQLDEMKRANDLAEDAAFQHRMDELRNTVLDAGHLPYNPSLLTPQIVIAPPSTTIGSYDPDSLANPYGAGSPYKADGLMNPYSQYGSPYSSKSWRNPYATDTPKLYDSQGNYRGKLSANPYDPDSISNPYGRFGNPYSADSINNPYGLGNPYRSDPVYVVPSR